MKFFTVKQLQRTGKIGWTIKKWKNPQKHQANSPAIMLASSSSR
jgi:hypothetical protein